MSTILVVDDSIVARMLATKAASRIFPDDTIVQAEDGLKALDAIAGEAAQDLQLALIDYHMPEMNGLELAVNLHQILPKLRILLCTANAQDAMAERATEIGIEVIFKPITEDKLRTQLQCRSAS